MNRLLTKFKKMARALKQANPEKYEAFLEKIVINKLEHDTSRE